MLQKLHHVIPKLKDVAETPPRNAYLYCERKFVKVFISFLVAQVSFPSKFASVFSAIKHHSSVLLLAQKFWSKKKIYIYIYFCQNQPINVQIFEIFECLRQNLSNFSCQFWTEKSLPFSYFPSFFINIVHNTNFELIHFLLWIKDLIKVSILQLSRNLRNSSCHSSNQKSVFL